MKKVFWVLAVIFPSVTYAQLQIGAGTTWRSDASTYVVLNNTGLQYNTNTQVIDNIFKFTGNTDAAISGTNLPVLSQIQIAKTGIAKIILQNDININQSVTFQSGLFDLGNNSLTLGTAASISGENETNRFMSSGTGEIVMYPTINNVPLGVNPGNLGARITSSANLGTVIIRRGHTSQTSNGVGSSILRYYNIEPANNTGLNATLRFHFLEAELNGLLESSLTMWKSSNNINWQNVGFTSRNTISNWVELTGINGFSRWTLSSPGNALPLSWNSFAAICNDNKVTVSWKTLQELNTLSFEIQRSSNGFAWNTIGTIAAAGTSNAALNYSFDDLQPGLAITFYRILQKDIDGRSSYSPILRTNCSGKDDFKLFPTVTNDIITILNPATTPIQKVQVRIVDFSGKTVLVKEMQGQTNQLSLQHLAAGIYSVEIKSGEIIKRVKVLRQ